MHSFLTPSIETLVASKANAYHNHNVNILGGLVRGGSRISGRGVQLFQEGVRLFYRDPANTEPPRVHLTMSALP